MCVINSDLVFHFGFCFLLFAMKMLLQLGVYIPQIMQN